MAPDEESKGVNEPYSFNKNKNKPSGEARVSSSNDGPTTVQKKVAGPNKDLAYKFSEFLIAEKQRKFVRLPRLFGKRKSMAFRCPNCKSDKEQKTKLKYECTGNQFCICIVCCFFACYPLCCVPFCLKRCYNIKHLCP